MDPACRGGMNGGGAGNSPQDILRAGAHRGTRSCGWLDTRPLPSLEQGGQEGGLALGSPSFTCSCRKMPRPPSGTQDSARA